MDAWTRQHVPATRGSDGLRRRIAVVLAVASFAVVQTVPGHAVLPLTLPDLGPDGPAGTSSYGLTLDASATNVGVGVYVQLDARVTSGTPIISIYDMTSCQRIARNAWSSSISTSFARLDTGTRSYKAFVTSGFSDACPPSGILEQTSLRSVTWSAWSVNLSTNTTRTSNTDSARLTARANHLIRSPVVLQIESTTTPTIYKTCDWSANSDTCEVDVSGSGAVLGETKGFRAVVKGSYCCSNTYIWATSNSVWVTYDPLVPPTATVLTINPATQTRTVGETASVSARVLDQYNRPVTGTTVTFRATGAHSRTGNAQTDANGFATYTYPGSTPGIDAVEAHVAGAPATGWAAVTWQAPPPPPAATAILLSPFAQTRPVGSTATLVARVLDQYGNPMPGVTVSFARSWSNPGSGSAVTDGNGDAIYTYTCTNAGLDTVRATVAGSSAVGPDAAVVCEAPPPPVTVPPTSIPPTTVPNPFATSTTSPPP